VVTHASILALTRQRQTYLQVEGQYDLQSLSQDTPTTQRKPVLKTIQSTNQPTNQPTKQTNKQNKKASKQANKIQETVIVVIVSCLFLLF
jgi:ABC-type Na+ efflux pump permease subunit